VVGLRDSFQDFQTDLHCGGRDGMFEDDDVFVVWDRDDITKLRDFLNMVLKHHDVVSSTVPDKRSCLSCRFLNYNPSLMPENSFDIGCDKLHFVGVNNDEHFQRLKLSNDCTDFDSVARL